LIDIDRIDSVIHLFKKLAIKQLKIRVIRCFFIYPLKIIENAKDDEILGPNLQLFFWRNVKNIVWQTKKAAFQEFLFSLQETIYSKKSQKDL
jgi:hypothetical protein